MGVPTLTIPFSTITPITIGSRDLKICCGKTCKERDKRKGEVIDEVVLQSIVQSHPECLSLSVDVFIVVHSELRITAIDFTTGCVQL